ncbi:MAG TPA: 5-formyltetrahydrofolate cyclo-ligase [Steroidobacteraceae bacterium]|nr:5-formyltetrahydrofolate cyclo-ligase [Steroidobacteraceae bacterium]
MNSELLAARKALRAELRSRRRQIPSEVRALAERRIASHIERHFHLHPGQRVALYAPLPHELDVAPLARLARLHGCRIYLPRLTDRRKHRMSFVEAHGPMRANSLGILEPGAARSIAPRRLDLVFLPLVGFDTAGMRLGMGGGYYDRAFAFLRLRTTWHRPKLIGVGFAMQRVAGLARAPHDLHLDAVATEEGVLRCPSG